MAFAVRRITKPEELLSLVVEKRALEDFRPGALDHISFFATDKTGFFVGELDDRPISTVSIIKHTENYAFIGNYLVYQPYRGKGYGLKTWKAAMSLSNLRTECNMGLDATAEKEYVYEKSGFKRAWFAARVEFVASQALPILSNIAQNSPKPEIMSISKTFLDTVIDYDSSIHAFSRRNFLEKWIFAPNSHSFVALNNGKIVGYVVVRSVIKSEQGWRIGPLHADNSDVAHHLYLSVFERIAAEDQKGIVCGDIPYGDLVNESAHLIASRLSDTTIMTCIRMYTAGVPPNMQLDKIFVHTALEVY